MSSNYNKLKNKIVKSELHIRFSDASIPDIVKVIDNKEELSLINVKYLRNLVRNHDPKLHDYTKNRKLRFIYNGKPISLFADFKESLENFEKLITNDDDEDNDSFYEGIGNTSQSLLSNEPPSAQAIVHKIYIHCIIGDILTPAEFAAEDKDDDFPRNTQQRQEPVGFDRLLNIGFSEQEVANFRRQFMTAQQGRLRRTNANELDEEYDSSDDEDNDNENMNERHQRPVQEMANNFSTEDSIRQMEETWLDHSADNPETDPSRTRGFLRFGLAQEGQTDNRNIFFGMLIGSIFGVISLLLLKNEFKFLDKQTRVAIVVGAIINISFALVLQLT